MMMMMRMPYPQLIGADAASSPRLVDIDRMLLTHLQKIREIRRFKRSLIVLCVENNYGGPPNAERIIQVLTSARALAPIAWRSRKTGTKEVFGISTNKLLKDKYINALGCALRSNAVAISPMAEFATSSEKPNRFSTSSSSSSAAAAAADSKASYPSVVTELASQLEGFRYVVDYNDRDPTKDPRVSASGKYEGKKDDLAFVFMMSVYWTIDAVTNHADLLNCLRSSV